MCVELCLELQFYYNDQCIFLCQYLISFNYYVFVIQLEICKKIDSSAGDGELMFAVDKRWRDSNILSSLQTPFTVNQIVHPIDDELHQLHL